MIVSSTRWLLNSLCVTWWQQLLTHINTNCVIPKKIMYTQFFFLRPSNLTNWNNSVIDDNLLTNAFWCALMSLRIFKCIWRWYSDNTTLWDGCAFDTRLIEIQLQNCISYQTVCKTNRFEGWRWQSKRFNKRWAWKEKTNGNPRAENRESEKETQIWLTLFAIILFIGYRLNLLRWDAMQCNESA